MSELPVTDSSTVVEKGYVAAAAEKPKRPKKKGPSLAQLHAKPLPLDIHPLPAFHPSNPISLLRLAYTWLSHLLLRPSSHPTVPYAGYFSPETRSVHVTDLQHARALWEMGFFGKGALSRSEPSWLQREKARLRKQRSGARGRVAAEDATNARREERRLFKLERAMLERERIERQRLVEEGKLRSAELEGLDNIDVSVHTLTNDVDEESQPIATDHGDHASTAADGATDHTDEDDKRAVTANGNIHVVPNGRVPDAGLLQPPVQSSQAEASPSTQEHPNESEDDCLDFDAVDQEHLQLTLEEAFFLSYGLGVLSIHPPPHDGSSQLSPKSLPEAYSTADLMTMFSRHSFFPPAAPLEMIQLDDQFMLNYVAYHHFRSLGWVVRSGVKFSVDYLLYNRGPAFSHAEFAVTIMPSYTDRYWNTPGGRARRRVYEQKDWWWLHCVNRVQSQVMKTLVLCYVDVPSPFDLILDQVEEEEIDVGKLLRRYKVREFIVRRWLANRSRD